MAPKGIEGWTISDADRAELEALPAPAEIGFDPNAKDISYPHCNSWATSKHCTTDQGLTAGVYWEERCVHADGSVTKTFTCVPG